ncbi:MAG: ComF family protein [Micavibrio sp.]|nr:MAG: ComF family protein [Micavibrio sp.]
MNARAFFSKTVDFILPPRCAVTGTPVDAPGMISADVWAQMRFIDAPFCRLCGLPFDFLEAEDAEDAENTENMEMFCGACLDNPPVFDRARSAFVYQGAGRDLILAFKHGDRLHLVRALTQWTMRAGAEILKKTDTLIPVPLHRRRLWQRRYNQSALLARALAEKYPQMVYAPEALRRIRATPPQKGLSRKERQKNMRRAFAVPETAAPATSAAAVLKDKNVTLIDDVFTSGATLNACAAVLKKAGAQNVFALTPARVVLE